MTKISLSDPRVIIAGIRQFGLASDGSDLRDLEAALAPDASGTGGLREADAWQWRWREPHDGARWVAWRHVKEPIEEFRSLWKDNMTGDPNKCIVELRPLYAALRDQRASDRYDDLIARLQRTPDTFADATRIMEEAADALIAMSRRSFDKSAQPPGEGK